MTVTESVAQRLSARAGPPASAEISGSSMGVREATIVTADVGIGGTVSAWTDASRC